MSDPTRVLIAGANGHLGRRLIARLSPSVPIVATVRSSTARRAIEQTVASIERGAASSESAATSIENAAASVESAAASVEIIELDYRDAGALADAADGCAVAVNLVGILKQTAANRYVDAHERATEALVVAAHARQLRRIVYVSILGSDPNSPNAALASKGRAERILLASGVPTLILRVPMVLGEGDYASGALRRRAHSRVAFLVRGASLEQPIYAGDVVDAIVVGIALTGRDNIVLDLAGPESLSRTDLVERAGACVGNRPMRISLPLAPVLGLAWFAERLMTNPPVTRAMLEVLDHDDCIDPMPAAAKLGIRLTPLDEMLAASLSDNKGIRAPFRGGKAV